MKFIKHWTLLITACLITSGCMTYRDFPKDMIGKPPTAKPYKKISYKIDKFQALTLAGGDEALKEALRRKTPFQISEPVEAMPEKGIFCLVTVEPKPISLAVVGAGYLSYSTMGILPVWSTKDGFRIRYDLFWMAKK